MIRTMIRIACCRLRDTQLWSPGPYEKWEVVARGHSVEPSKHNPFGVVYLRGSNTAYVETNESLPSGELIYAERTV